MKTKPNGKLMGGGIPQQVEVARLDGVAIHDDPNQCV